MRYALIFKSFYFELWGVQTVKCLCYNFAFFRLPESHFWKGKQSCINTLPPMLATPF